MFNVGRYDPRKEALAKASRPGTSSSKATQNNTSKSKSRRKRRRKDEGQKDESRHEGTPKTSATKPSQEKNYVIAPEAKGPRSGPRKQGKIEEEAFDDMELEDDLVFGINKEEAVFEKVPKKQKTDGDDVSDPSAKEVTSAIRMSNFPILEAAKKWNLAPFLVKNLEKQGFENFFPIQALVIPDVIASERYSNIRAQDICVAAPTGSGKTLAFVLPVLNSLAGRRIKRLRALVVLPSRDLGRFRLTAFILVLNSVHSYYHPTAYISLYFQLNKSTRFFNSLPRGQIFRSD